MPAHKGFRPPNAGKGRIKGSVNKTTVEMRTIRACVAEAFHGLGGTQGLMRWAKDNQTAFYQIAARLIPVEMTGAGGGPIQVAHTVIDELHPDH